MMSNPKEKVKYDREMNGTPSLAHHIMSRKAILDKYEHCNWGHTLRGTQLTSHTHPAARCQKRIETVPPRSQQINPKRPSNLLDPDFPTQQGPPQLPFQPLPSLYSSVPYQTCSALVTRVSCPATQRKAKRRAHGKKGRSGSTTKRGRGAFWRGARFVYP
jgi:hypothetical protein